MNFYQKYALLDPVPGVGTKSFQARQISTGRDVTVHLLEPGETPVSEALLSRLRNLPPQAMSKLIEVGDHEGTRYVVTVAPPYLHLDDWLAEQEGAAPGHDARQFTRAGAWKIPVTRPEPLLAQPELQLAQPEPLAALDPAGTALDSAGAAPGPPEPAVHEPGEFTRMFQQSAPLAAPTAQMPVPIPVAPEAVNPSAVPLPAAASGGEFTRLFQSPLPPAPAGDDWPPAEPKSPEAGGFTKMFQSPTPNAKAAPAGTPQEGGEFTRFFQSPPPGKSPGPNLPSASVFPAAAPPPTNFAMPPAPSQPGARPPGGGSATQAFSIPSSAPAPASTPLGPSEYTRMMSAQPNPGAAQAMQMPQPAMPQPMMPQPMMPQPRMPQPRMPQPTAVQAPGNNLLLIGILLLLAFLAGGLIVLLLVRR